MTTQPAVDRDARARRLARGCLVWVMSYFAACYAFWGFMWIENLALGDSSSIFPTAPADTDPLIPVPSPLVVFALSPVIVPMIMIAGSGAAVLGTVWPDLRPAIGGSLLAWLAFLLPLVLTRLLAAVVRRIVGRIAKRQPAPASAGADGNGQAKA